MGCNGDSGSDDDKVFNNVLPFHGGHHKTGPGFLRQENEGHEGSDHVNEKQWQHYPLETLDQKENTDQTFKYTKRNKKCSKGHERHRLLKELLYQLTRGAQPHHLQKPKPKEDYKKSEPCYWYRNFSKEMYKSNVYISYHS